MSLKRLIKRQKKKNGFTLVELIVVMCIIGILAGALIPQVSGYITEAKKLKIIDQSRSIVMAVDSYNLKCKISEKISGKESVGQVKSKNGVNKYFDDIDKSLDKLRDDVLIEDCRKIVAGTDFTIDDEEKLYKLVED